MICAVRWRHFAFWAVVVIVCELALCLLLMFGGESDRATSTVGYTVVVDAGHGGIDGGVVAADGTKESDLNLLYAKTLGRKLTECGFAVVYTRKNADGLYGLPTNGFKKRDMRARRDIVERSAANLVVSIHMNKYSRSSSRSGAQVFFQTDDIVGRRLADCMQRVLNDMSGNDFAALGGDYYMCREMPCPSVICECGFVSNPDDLANLKDEGYRERFCTELMRGIVYFLADND